MYKRQLLYHLGRWIYLIDAQDDLEEDAQAGRYNPVAARFGPQGNREALELTLNHSLNSMYSAAQLLSFGSDVYKRQPCWMRMTSRLLIPISA